MKVTVGTVARRRTELGLLVLGVGLTGSLYTLASLAKSAKLPLNLRAFLVAVSAMLLLAHFIVRRTARHADATLLPLAALLNGIGYVFIARLRPTYAPKQALWTAVAIGAFSLTMIFARNIRNLEYFRYSFAIGGIILLLLPMVPGIGYERNGSRIWAHFGPVSFQPGEIAKLTLAIFMASFLVERRELLALAGRRVFGMTFPEAKHLGPVALAWLLSMMVMVLEKDLGSSLLFFALFLAMLWVATGRGSFVVITGVMFFGGATLAYRIFAHVQVRVSTWINPWPTASGKGYQIVQSLYAFGSGGITGTGINLGSPTRIPASHNDFILAAIGEELGLAGSVAVVVIFFLIVGAGLRIALRADSPFEKLLAAGLTTIIGVQTFIIVGGVTRLVPLTGVTLPFVSYGGSSLVVNYVLIALLLRISHDANVRHGDAVPLTALERRGQRRRQHKLDAVADDVTSLDLRPDRPIETDR